MDEMSEFPMGKKEFADFAVHIRRWTEVERRSYLKFAMDDRGFVYLIQIWKETKIVATAAAAVAAEAPRKNLRPHRTKPPENSEVQKRLRPIEKFAEY